MLAQNDPLEWTHRIGGLPHDDDRSPSDAKVIREKVGETAPPAAHVSYATHCGRPCVGAASPHPHGRRQRLPRVLGEQQQPHRGEHLGEREREGTERIFSGSRGLGHVVGRWEMISVLSNVSCVQLCQIDLCSGRRKKRVDTSVGSIEERCANGVCEERACCAASTQ